MKNGSVDKNGWRLAYGIAVSHCVLYCCFVSLLCIVFYTLPRLSVLEAPVMYRREGRCWIPGSFSVLACGSLALLPDVLIFRLAFVYA